MTSDRERLAEIIIEYMPGADGAVDSRTIADAIIAAGFVQGPVWEYGVSEVLMGGATAFGFPAPSIAEAKATQAEMRRNYPWPEEIRLARRRQAGPWEHINDSPEGV